MNNKTMNDLTEVFEKELELESTIDVEAKVEESKSAVVEETKTNTTEEVKTPVEEESNKSEIANKIDEDVLLNIEELEDNTNPCVQIKEESTPASNFFKKVNVDIDNLDIIDSNPMNKIKNTNFVMNKKSKTQIVAVQSGYVGYVEGYNFDEINSLINSTLDDYANQLLLCQTVHRSLNNTSAGQLSFDQWAANTSYYDLESFYYGNYIETFPGNTDFNIKCGTCEKHIEAKVNNDTIISAKNDSTREMLSTILDNKGDTTELMKQSIIHKTNKVLLEDSKIVVEFRLPSIKKHLDLLSSINATAKDKNRHILTFLLFVDRMYIMDIEKSVESNTPKYNQVTDRNEVAGLLKNLSYRDAKILTKEINDKIELYQVQFKIKSFECTACGNPIGDIPVEMESLLFFQMHQ